MAPDFNERANGFVLVVGGALIALSLAVAIWATLAYHQSSRSVSFDPEPVPTTERVVVTAPAPFRPLARAARPAFRPVATSPMGWNDLTLMLRTGLSDEEVISAAASKQLTFAVGPEQERLLRGMGAGNPLIAYLQRLPLYRTDDSAPAARSAAAPIIPRVTAPQTSVAIPVAAPPVVDYAARDRQIASLKRRIDQLDDDIRITRTNPRTTPYCWQYRWNGSRVDQTSYDAYLKRLDDERNDLRRQKWQLEGR